jgi:predicted metal-dependent hydrolase
MTTMTQTTVTTETTTPQTSNADRKVPTRRISFEESLQTVPRHFAVEGDLILSHLAASLSSVFPDGEDFFVRSVRHFRDDITDPALKRQVAGFIGQEAVHGREHRAFNDRLDELGYPTKRFERITKWGLELRERIAPPKSNLAATAALEHFTATLAELVLTSEETRTLFGHDEVRNLFLWHALEESEHKAVAFDVYKAVGGTERMRVWTMNFLRYGFVLGMAAQIVISLLGDRETYRRGKLRASWRRVKASPILGRELWDQLKDYNRPDFHPDDRDTTALVEEWRAELFGAQGTLNDKLAKPAA